MEIRSGWVSINAGEGIVIFDREEPDTDYRVVVCCDNTERWMVGKFTDRFIIYPDNPSSTSAYDWILVRS